MTKEDTIWKVTIEYAKGLRERAAVAFPPKKIFRKKDRRPLVRIRKQSAQIAAVAGAAMCAARIATICATPLPKKELQSGSSGYAFEMPNNEDTWAFIEALKNAHALL